MSLQPTSQERHEYRKLVSFMVDPPDFQEWLATRRRAESSYSLILDGIKWLDSLDPRRPNADR